MPTYQKTVTETHHVCSKCGRDWIPRRTVKPAVCPQCKCATWDRVKEVPTTETTLTPEIVKFAFDTMTTEEIAAKINDEEFREKFIEYQKAKQGPPLVDEVEIENK